MRPAEPLLPSSEVGETSNGSQRFGTGVKPGRAGRKGLRKPVHFPYNSHFWIEKQVEIRKPFPVLICFREQEI